MKTTFRSFWNRKKVPMQKNEWINSVFLPRLKEHLDALDAQESMRFATDGGKRIRPQMVFCGASAIVGEEHFDSSLLSALADCACAVELIHAHSLVHDDLPCMDNDRYRRGKLSVHAAFGEAEALLCGDALLNGAYEVLFTSLSNANEPLTVRLAKASTLLSRMSGLHGMIGGQILDMQSNVCDTQALRRMVEKKTGALFAASCGMGAILAGANEKETNIAIRFGALYGLAFQLKDDEGDWQQDEKEQKQTYFSALGTSVKQQREALFSSAVSLAKGFAHGEKLIAIFSELVRE